jgi:hypothetical protein
MNVGTRMRCAAGRLLALGALALVGTAPCVPAQMRAELPSGRRATTVEALATYPSFFHLQSVRLRGRLVTDDVGTALLSAESRVLLLGDAARASPDGDVEVLGAFLDVGRLPQDDPRVATHDLMGLSQRVLGRDWPAQGDLLVVVAHQVDVDEPSTVASVRAIALDPGRYEGETVTVAGRFRGRNLFADQPAAPGRSRFDFVVQLADASVWVTGRQPRGKGFDLRVDQRVDTGRWLEVVGTVHSARGLVWIEATDLRAAEPVEEIETTEALPDAPVAPPPTVVFSAPTQDEFDVSRTARVRIQFSRDMDPGSFKGQIRAHYRPSEATERGEPQPPSLPVTVSYDGGRRVLELQFDDGLERFRTVEVELGSGISAVDDQPLTPWTLVFTVGG